MSGMVFIYLYVQTYMNSIDLEGMIFMAQRSHGLFVGRTRQLARHHKPSRLGITKLIKHFNIDDKVVISPKGNFSNIPHPRYRGRVGTVTAKRGDAYVVIIHTSKSTMRTLIVPQMHLEKA